MGFFFQKQVKMNISLSRVCVCIYEKKGSISKTGRTYFGILKEINLSPDKNIPPKILQFVLNLFCEIRPHGKFIISVPKYSVLILFSLL